MANMTFKANLLPNSTTGEYSLGSSTNKWAVKGTLNGAHIFYGVCDTATATTAKTVTCDDFTADDLVVGATVIVNMKNTNSGAKGSLTLSVNGTTAKPIRYQYNASTSAIPDVSYLLGNKNYIFCYDGTNWIVTNIHYNSNTTYSKMTAAEMQGGTATSARTIAAVDLASNYLQLTGGTMTGAIYTKGLIGTENIDYGPTLPTSAIPGQLFFQTSTTVVYSVPAGGSAGYALMKNSNTDGDFSWQQVQTELSAMSAAEIKGGTVTTARTMRADYIKSALSGLGGTGLTFTHNSTSGIVLNHTNSATTKSSYVDSATTANAAGGTIKVTDVKYDGQGHITTTQDRTITLGLVQGYGDTTNPYASKTKGYILAAPASTNGAPSFRALALSDLPELNINTATTGVLTIDRGGTGATNAGAAWTALGGGSVGKVNLSTSANYYLAGNGTWSVPPGTYILPEATTAVLGGVTIDEDGGIVADAGAISIDWSGAPVQSVNGQTGAVTLANLNIGTQHYNGATAVTVAISDLGLASPMTFRGVTDTTLVNETDVTPINIVSGGTIGSLTPAAGDVVLQKTEQIEYIYSGDAWHQLGIASSYSLAEHSHGYILNDGIINTAVTATASDRLLIADASDTGRIVASTLVFDSTSTQAALSKTGQWVNYLQTAGGTMTGALKTKGLLGTVNVDYGDVLPMTATEGQIFFQVSYGDNDFSLPAGGTAGYALVKNSGADGDVKWGLITATDRVLKAGDTMTGNLTVAPATTAVFITARGASNVATTLHVGSGGINRGIYDNTLDKWLIYCDGTDARTQLKLYGAVWNDYAEFRQADINDPGRCIKENGDDTLSFTTERLERGCEIISDTFGFAIGQTDKAKTPTAASGRVLAYPYENREEFKKHIGWPVCSGPGGTVSIMTEEEEIKYPSRIIGTISAVPDYPLWFGGSKGDNPIKVNGRVWIRIR